MQGVYFGEGDSLANWPHSGQGGAFRQIGDTKIAVFTVVNALGTIVDREGRVVRCSRNDVDAACPHIEDLLESKIGTLAGQGESGEGLSQNNTISLVVTNQKMSFADLQRLAVQVHTSIARAIVPFSTNRDGDSLYAVSTGEVENPDLDSTDLALAASELAGDAILSSVPELPPNPEVGPHVTEGRDLRGLPGTYRFADGSSVAVSAHEGRLVAKFAKGFLQGNIFLEEGMEYALLPAGEAAFVVDTPARDVVRFDRAKGKGLTLNPGPWAQEAERTH